ncbi:gastrula zinc finger protein XlCGF52.1 [Malaya genurostris]|uniref:gastrula zinc finger protein XlCGF52.1 n=1 Tax=Malaya genurostris TaxID=325434 RepID=UPI0026F3DD06|nr:gastrula zinc finger protein XlCGF52.1 [Malaya genurostris]
MTSPVSKECTICSKPLKNRSSRLYHEHCQNPKLKPFKCHTCERTFSSKSHKTFHEESHQGRRLSCDRCDKTYQHKRDLDLHLREHDANEVHTCNKCPESFTTPQALMKHRRSHSDKIRFTCAHCDLSFSLKGNLVKHVKVLHSKEKRYPCGQCGKSFYRNNALKFHMLNHQVRNYQCRTCKKEFVDARNLERHMKIHLSLKEFRCDICGISSSRKDNIIRHAKSFHPETNPSNVVLRGTLGDHLNVIKQDAQLSIKSPQEIEPSVTKPDSNRVSVIQVIGVPKPLEINNIITKEPITRKVDQSSKPTCKVDPLEIYRKILKPSIDDDDEKNDDDDDDDEDDDDVSDKNQELPRTSVSSDASKHQPPPVMRTGVATANTNNSSSSNNFASINNFSEVHWRKRTSQIFTNSTR